MSQILRAHVVLRGAGSGVKKRHTRSEAGPLEVDDARREVVADALKRLGLVVRRIGPFSISVSGSRETFERAFASRLLLRDVGGRIEASWAGPVSIPPALAGLVEAVVFPESVQPL